MSIVIGLCGASGSGKTTLANMLASDFNSTTFGLDDYFILYPPLKKYEDDEKNWELPENTDWSACRTLVKEIKGENNTVTVRKIDWETNSYSEYKVQKTEINVVEGFLLLHDDELVNLFDLTVYIDVSDKVGIERRLRRSGEDTNRDWYEQVTFPEYAARRNVFKQKADLVLNGEDDLEKNFLILRNKIQSVIYK
jgi:uridine kinase